VLKDEAAKKAEEEKAEKEAKRVQALLDADTKKEKKAQELADKAAEDEAARIEMEKKIQNQYDQDLQK
jgi:hypothetical protein